jgi:hypothetical protein
MKNLLILSLSLLLGGQMASASDVNFSGDWAGICKMNGREVPSQKKIVQEGRAAIEINGQRFDLTKPTVVTLDDEDQGQKYSEVTVYDFQWSEDFQQINTSARWVGWYKDKPGSWSGNGVGVIKFENERLITTRTFEGKEEYCSYDKKS